jgi:CBS domain-containing protein
MNSLLSFTKKNVFVLRQNATALEAARTMAEHRVGCVLVADGSGHIDGIITDRDLACKIVAYSEDPNILLSEIMQSPLISVERNATIDDVIKIMKRHGIRRVPILETLKNGTQKCVGIVTLDDLLYRQLITPRALRQIVTRQVRIPHFRKLWVDQRKKGRQETTLNAFYKLLAREMKVSRPTAVAVGGFLLSSIVERISPNEARHFIAELPKLLQDDLLDIPGPNRKITPRFILQHLDEDFGFDTRSAYQLVRGFWNGLEFFMMGHQTEHVLAQFSKELQVFFTGEQFKKLPPSAISHSVPAAS